MLVLVNMPGAEVTRPSLALGVLKACLTPHGVPVRNVYANLRWFQQLGAVAHERVIGTSPADMMVEWVFAETAFGRDASTEANAFAELVAARDAKVGKRGVAAIADELRALREGASAFIDELADDVLALQPTAVGCTSMFQQHTASLGLLRAIKARAPHVATLLGGANCESEMGQATHARCAWVDYVVSGEAEEVVWPLWRHIRGEADVALPPSVFTPAHRDDAYPPIGPDTRGTIVDMDTVPTPDFDDYFDALRADPALAMVLPGLPFETSRGCWWGAKHHCTFCGLNGSGMTFRVRAPERALEEVRALETRYGVNRLEAVDNILAMPYFERVLPALAADGRERHLFFETKANLRTTQVDALAAAGVRWIQPGIESLDTRVLKLMRKGTTAVQNVRLLRDAAAAGVQVIWAMIVGFPGEDDAWLGEVAALLPALHHLAPGGVAALRYDRFSPYHASPEAWGLELRPAAPYAHVYPFDADGLRDVAYYFDRADQGELVGGLAHRVLRDHPGAEALRLALAAWTTRHATAALYVAGEGDARVVHDSRSGAPTTTACDDATLALLVACADGVDPERALASVADRFAASDAERVARRALDARWIVELDGRWLRVAHLQAPNDAPADICFPGGTLLDPALLAG